MKILEGISFWGTWFFTAVLRIKLKHTLDIGVGDLR